VSQRCLRNLSARPRTVVPFSVSSATTYVALSCPAKPYLVVPLFVHEQVLPVREALAVVVPLVSVSAPVAGAHETVRSPKVRVRNLDVTRKP